VEGGLEERANDDKRGRRRRRKVSVGGKGEDEREGREVKLKNELNLF